MSNSYLYFDCINGVSGDMILAALTDAGADIAAQLEEGLNLPGYRIHSRQVKRGGLRARKIDVELLEQHPLPRGLKDITAIIDSATLSERVKQRSLAAFGLLAEAEAKVHGVAPDDVHFHEVGAVDAIVDVVGSMAGLEQFGADRVYCSPIPVGRGSVQNAHGRLPVPAPATVELLRGVPILPGEADYELATPTGVAILRAVVEDFGRMPAMTLDGVGIGAGREDDPHRPNILRILLGRAASDSGESDAVWELSANVDDMSGELLGAIFEPLFAAGALDVFLTPVMGKKNRPAMTLTVLVEPAKREAVEDEIFVQTTTFGIRRHLCRRSKLVREQVEVKTPFGPVRIKQGRRGGRVITASPEFEDCRRIAEDLGVPIRRVYNAALTTEQQRTVNMKGNKP